MDPTQGDRWNNNSPIWKWEERFNQLDKKLTELEDKVDSLWLALKITEDRQERRGRFLRAVLQSLALVGGIGGAAVAVLNYFFPNAPPG